MANNNDNINKALSLLLTLLMGAGIVALLLFTSLHYDYPPKDAELQQLLQDSIVFGGEEYVALGDLLEPVNSDDLAPNGEDTPENEAVDDDSPQDVGQNDLKDQGSIDEPPKPQVARTQESPMKVKEQQPKKPQAEKKTEQPAPAQKKANPKEQTAPKKTENPKPATPAPPSEASNRIKNAFGNKGGSGSGKQGSPNGSENSSTVGRPGVGGLDGYTLAYFPTAKCPGPGTVVVRVTVSPTGHVSNATVTGGSLRSNSRACGICLNLARQSRFSVPKGQNIERSGTLTYTIR